MFTNVKPYVMENSDFVFDNASSNSFDNLGQKMVVGIVINQAVIMIIGKTVIRRFNNFAFQVL